MKCLLISLVSLIIITGAVASPQIAAKLDPLPNGLPRSGVVPDANTATELVKVMLKPIIGTESVEAFDYFNATLSGTKWTVKGGFKKPIKPSNTRRWIPPHKGSVTVTLSKTDGRMLKFAISR